ncbi:MAG: adenylosuccinate lyase, partial [Methanobrevibacter sp.]|nr:adenylosuccinate lyase [Methanobrevibacter sp.]
MAIHPIEFRYGTPEMKKIWETENKLQRMLDVESALAQAEGKLGIIPQEVADEIAKKANTKYVKEERVNEIEKQTKHDIGAIVKGLGEVCDNGAGEYVHFGATSNDVVDSSNSLLIKDSAEVIKDKIKTLTKILLKLAEENIDKVAVGRTHGQHALPITYGMKFALWADELHRQYERVNNAENNVCVAMMDGAVGTTAALGEQGWEIHKTVAEILELPAASITNQVVQRDNHVEFIMALANLASSLDKMALEIRNLQRTELMEVGEYFDPEKQMGSSTMPHKMNPITAERICGVARIVKSFVNAALDNNPLWHERDLTNS